MRIEALSASSGHEEILRHCLLRSWFRIHAIQRATCAKATFLDSTFMSRPMKHFHGAKLCGMPSFPNETSSGDLTVQMERTMCVFFLMLGWFLAVHSKFRYVMNHCNVRWEISNLNFYPQRPLLQNEGLTPIELKYDMPVTTDTKPCPQQFLLQNESLTPLDLKHGSVTLRNLQVTDVKPCFSTPKMRSLFAANWGFSLCWHLQTRGEFHGKAAALAQDVTSLLRASRWAHNSHKNEKCQAWNGWIVRWDRKTVQLHRNEDPVPKSKAQHAKSCSQIQIRTHKILLPNPNQNLQTALQWRYLKRETERWLHTNWSIALGGEWKCFSHYFL